MEKISFLLLLLVLLLLEHMYPIHQTGDQSQKKKKKEP